LREQDIVERLDLP